MIDDLRRAYQRALVLTDEPLTPAHVRLGIAGVYEGIAAELDARTHVALRQWRFVDALRHAIEARDLRRRAAWFRSEALS